MLFGLTVTDSDHYFSIVIILLFFTNWGNCDYKQLSMLHVYFTSDAPQAWCKLCLILSPLRCPSILYSSLSDGFFRGSLCVHPGACGTNLPHDGFKLLWLLLGRWLWCYCSHGLLHQRLAYTAPRFQLSSSSFPAFVVVSDRIAQFSMECRKT